MSKSPKKAESLKLKANEAFHAENYEKALLLYTEALAAQRTATLHSNRSACHAALGRWQEALQDANDCLTMDPTFVKGYCRLARALMGLKRPGHAENALRKALAQWPSENMLRALLDQIRKEDGDPREEDFPKADLQQIEWWMVDRKWECEGGLIEATYKGDWSTFEALFQPEHIQIRVPPLSRPLLHIAVLGAVRSAVSKIQRKAEYLKILKLLLEAGARVDARDMAGYTALMHAALVPPDTQVLQALLHVGADVHAKEIMGRTPLHWAVVGRHAEAIKLLIAAGAERDVPDRYDGLTPRTLAEQESAEMLEVLTKKSPLACAVCANPVAKKYCAQCLVTRYCSTVCQKADWTEHKLRCQGRPQTKQPDSAGTLTLWLKKEMQGSPFVSVVNYKELLDKKGDKSMSWAKGLAIDDFKGAMHVKVQVPLNANPNMPMLAKSRNGELTAFIDPSCPDAPKLAALIRDRGIYGMKGYFRGRITPEGHLHLLATLLTHEDW